MLYCGFQILLNPFGDQILHHGPCNSFRFGKITIYTQVFPLHFSSEEKMMASRCPIYEIISQKNLFLTNDGFPVTLLCCCNECLLLRTWICRWSGQNIGQMWKRAKPDTTRMPLVFCPDHHQHTIENVLPHYDALLSLFKDNLPLEICSIDFSYPWSLEKATQAVQRRYYGNADWKQILPMPPVQSLLQDNRKPENAHASACWKEATQLQPVWLLEHQSF